MHIQSARDATRTLVACGAIKAMSLSAIFLATCNAILHLGDVKLVNTSFHYSLLIYFQYTKHLSQICIA